MHRKLLFFTDLSTNSDSSIHYKNILRLIEEVLMPNSTWAMKNRFRNFEVSCNLITGCGIKFIIRWCQDGTMLNGIILGLSCLAIWFVVVLRIIVGTCIVFGNGFGFVIVFPLVCFGFVAFAPCGTASLCISLICSWGEGPIDPSVHCGSFQKNFTGNCWFLQSLWCNKISNNNDMKEQRINSIE